MILYVITGISLVIAILSDPVSQATAYHNFADQRIIYGIPNIWNVLSNLPFALFGYMGLRKISMAPTISIPGHLSTAYTTFFAGVLCVAFGSAWYHLNPTNDTLFWDRLPMTIAFMALFSIIVSEYISDRTGKLMLWPLIALGLLSVVYWYISEQRGSGDLRLYILVQFLPMILLPLIFVMFKSSGTHSIYLWAMLILYIFSKITEHLDSEIFNFLGWTSGHSIKHLLASLGILCFYMRMRKLN